MQKAIFIAIILMMASVSIAATSERPMLVRVALTNPESYQILRQHDFDVVYFVKGEYAEIIADDADYKSLEDLGLSPTIIHDDLVAFYQSRFPVGATMGGFRTLAECKAYMDSLHTLFPAITTTRDSIGYTFQGRPIWAMKISDNPNADEDEPEFFVNSLIHAREPMGMEATLRFMRYLCDNYGVDPAITDLVNNREFYFVPVINPDGYEYNRQTAPSGGGMWRKNRHSTGIDLNRNWGYNWGYDDNGSSPDPGSETYRGTSAFSEPETQAMRQYVNSHHFSIAMNFHTYGGYFLYPWGYDDIYTSDQNLFMEIADSCVATSGYSRGTAWELLYNTNGDANDWMYGETSEKPRFFGFTIEIGESFDGFWPDPSRINTLWGHALPALLYLSQIADNPYAGGAPTAPVMNSIGDIFADRFTATWQHHDTLNPAVAYELKEMVGLQRGVDNLEAGLDNWNLRGFSLTNGRHHSGTYSFFSGSSNNYDGSANMTNPITVATNDTLKFWTWYSIETDWDYAYAQASTDGGASWINLPGNLTTNSNPNGTNLGNGITGESTNWIEAKFPLAAYAGQSVLLGLRYRTDTGVLYEGFYADDISPVESFQQVNVLGSAIPDTFFAVTNRGEGTYYYQVRARDAQSQWSNFSNRQIAIVHGGGGGCTYIPGDINGNGTFNGIDVTYSVGYFKGGLVPPYICNCDGSDWYVAGDVNGNCAFNGIDISYMVAYFKGGLAPIPCPACPPSR